MTVFDRLVPSSTRESAASPSCPQGLGSIDRAHPGANPGHFGGIAILPLFLDEPEVRDRRGRAAVRARRRG